MRMRSNFAILLATLTLQALAAAPFAWADPSNLEQLMIYELNRARNRPARYDKENSLGGIITTTTPQPPLAVNNSLVNSAIFHAEEMASCLPVPPGCYFAHQSAVTGDWPNKMATDAGYSLPNFYPSNSNNIESIAAGTNIDTALAVLNLLIIDANVPGAGHRVHLLATDPFFQTHREIGTGYGFNNSATYKNYFAIHTAVRQSGGNQFLTGVVYNDANSNRRYDQGEGLAGVTVSNGATSVQTNAAGGWAIEVNAGSYTVTASGGGFVGTGTAKTIVTNKNVEIDFVSGNASGELNFARQNNCALVAVDIDKDCKSDIAVYRNGLWIILRSIDAGVTATNFGGGTDVPLPADYDGDGKIDIAVYRNGLWIILRSSDGGVTATQFGGGSDVPLPADYDGDGKADIAVYRNGLWIVLRSSDSGVTATQFGGGSDVPLPADYDGDGKADVAVYRNGLWIVLRSSDSGVTATQFGGGTDVPLPADYDGDGRADIAVYRNGLWIVLKSSDNGVTATQFGGGSDVPVSADYDGDGKTDIAVYRNGLWIYQPSSGGVNVATQFGGGTDVPLKIFR